MNGGVLVSGLEERNLQEAGNRGNEALWQLLSSTPASSLPVIQLSRGLIASPCVIPTPLQILTHYIYVTL